VTYQVVINVPNPDLRLMPGMTATVAVQIWTANNVLRVPSVALRFRPSDDVFAEFHQPVPPEAHVKPGAGGGRVVPAVMEHAAPAQSIVGRAGELIDAFYQPMPRPDAMGTVWLMDGGHLKALAVRTGITDGTWTELTGGELQADDEVVTSIILPANVHPAPAPTAANPLMPQNRGTGPARPTGR